MFCSVRQRGVADLDLQIREGGGHPDTEIRGGGRLVSKIFFFQPFGPQFGLNITGAGPPAPSPGSTTGERGWSIGRPGGSLLRCCTGPLRGYLKKQGVKVIQCNQVYFVCL